MPFKQLTANEFLPLLSETRAIWSAGLAGDKYYEFNDLQRKEPWGRRHQELWGYETDDGELAASLKLYKLNIQARHRNYPCYGVGAIYSRKRFRGQGYGGKIVESVVQKAYQDGQAALLLFSDIGSAFYEQYGFADVGSIDITIMLNAQGLDSRKLKAVKYTVEPLARCNLETLERYHRRWLSRRPYGVSRTLDYFRYKTAKEEFLHKHSNLPWPKLHVISVRSGENKQSEKDFAYAIFEVGHDSMRMLELVTSQALLTRLWTAIFAEAARQRFTRIRTWESNILDLAPTYSLKSFFKANVYLRGFAPTILYSQRSFGRVMICPLDKAAEPWLYCFPSPILELDHL